MALEFSGSLLLILLDWPLLLHLLLQAGQYSGFEHYFVCVCVCVCYEGEKNLLTFYLS